MKKWYKSKTIWIAVVQGLVGVVVAFSTVYPEVGYLLILKSVLEIVVRSITNTAITK